MNTAQEMRQRSLSIIHEARANLDADGSPEGVQKFDRAMAEVDALEARASRLEDADKRSAALNEVASTRSVEDRSVDQRTVSTDEVRATAFNAYLRGHELSSEQRSILREARAQSVGVNAEGGFLAPQSTVADVIQSMKAYGPLLDASVINYLVTSNGNTINMPLLDDTANRGRRIAEGVKAGAATNLTFGSRAMTAYKYTSDVVLVSAELLQDSAVDVASIINSAMAERLGRAVNLDLTTGDGSGDPQGIVTGAANGKTTASATAIAADELIDLQHSIDPAYRANASFMFADTTLAAIRKLKDTTGAYVWQPGLTVGAPATILGWNYAINQDMATIATGAKTVLAGDFKRAYTARRSRDIVIRRLDEIYAESDQVAFVGFARFDGAVLDSRALRALTQA
jgi:HK97 family phage major capsid protein